MECHSQPGGALSISPMECHSQPGGALTIPPMEYHSQPEGALSISPMEFRSQPDGATSVPGVECHFPSGNVIMVSPVAEFRSQPDGATSLSPIAEFASQTGGAASTPPTIESSQSRYVFGNSVGSHPRRQRDALPWAEDFLSIEPLTESDLHLVTACDTPKTVDTIKICVRDEDWQRLAYIFDILVGRKLITRNLIHIIKAFFQESPLSQLQVDFRKFVQALKQRGLKDETGTGRDVIAATGSPDVRADVKEERGVKRSLPGGAKTTTAKGKKQKKSQMTVACPSEKNVLMRFHEAYPRLAFSLDPSGTSKAPDFLASVVVEGRRVEASATSKKTAKRLCAEKVLALSRRETEPDRPSVSVSGSANGGGGGGGGTETRMTSTSRSRSSLAERSHVTTIGMALVAMCTDAGLRWRAHDLLVVLIEEGTLYMKLSCSPPIPTARLALTAVRVCLTVQMYSTIQDITRMTDWFRRPELPGRQRGRSLTLRALSAVLGELLWEVEGKSPRGQLPLDTRHRLISLMVDVAEHVIATYSANDETRYVCSKIIDVSGLVGCLLTLTCEHRLADLTLDVFKRCLASMDLHQVPLQSRTVTRVLDHLTFLQVKDVGRSTIETLKVLIYGVRRGLYPQQVPFSLSRKRHCVRFYETMSSYEMYAVIQASLDHIFDQLVLEADLMWSVPEAFRDHLSDVTIEMARIDGPSVPCGGGGHHRADGDVIAQPPCTPDPQLLVALRRAGLVFDHPTRGRVHLTPESVLRNIRSRFERRLREGDGGGDDGGDGDGGAGGGGGGGHGACAEDGNGVGTPNAAPPPPVWRAPPRPRRCPAGKPPGAVKLAALVHRNEKINVARSGFASGRCTVDEVRFKCGRSRAVAGQSRTSDDPEPTHVGLSGSSKDRDGEAGGQSGSSRDRGGDLEGQSASSRDRDGEAEGQSGSSRDGDGEAENPSCWSDDCIIQGGGQSELSSDVDQLESQLGSSKGHGAGTGSQSGSRKFHDVEVDSQSRPSSGQNIIDLTQ